MHPTHAPASAASPGPQVPALEACFLPWYPRVSAWGPCPQPALHPHPNLAAANAADNSCCRKAITVQMGCISVCVCVCVCVCVRARVHARVQGRGLGRQGALLMPHSLLFPANLLSPAPAASLHWTLSDGAWRSGQGADMPDWRVLVSLSSPFSSMSGSWTQRVAEPPPTQPLRPPGPWGDRTNLGVPDLC